MLISFKVDRLVKLRIFFSNLVNKNYLLGNMKIYFFD